jgi:hypothetical protein
MAGQSIGACYARGKLHQERELIDYPDWTPDAIAARQRRFAEFALKRWAVAGAPLQASSAVADEIESESDEEDLAVLESQKLGVEEPDLA